MAEASPPSKRQMVVVYHAGCLDGRASAWVFEQEWGKGKKSEASIKYIAYDHGDGEDKESAILSQLSPETELYFVDVVPGEDFLRKLLSPASLKEDAAEEFERLVKEVHIWDHHPTDAVETIKNFVPPAIAGFNPPPLDLAIDTKSLTGSKIVWEKIKGKEPLPPLFKYITKMDIPLPPDVQKTDEERAVGAYIDDALDQSTLSRAFRSFESFTETVAKGDLNQIIVEGNAILASQNKVTLESLDEVVYTHLEPLPGVGKMWIPLINVNIKNLGRDANTPLIAEALKGAGFGIIGLWQMKGNGQIHMSIRTSGLPPANEIAKHIGRLGIGGGGHETTSAAVQFRDHKQFFENVLIVPSIPRIHLLRAQWGSVMNSDIDGDREVDPPPPRRQRRRSGPGPHQS